MRSTFETIEVRKLTTIEKEILSMVGERKSAPIEQMADRINEVRRLISKGYLALVATTYIWGLDFQVVLTSKALAELSVELEQLILNRC
jgi:hypothetical protein